MQDGQRGHYRRKEHEVGLSSGPERWLERGGREGRNEGSVEPLRVR